MAIQETQKSNIHQQAWELVAEGDWLIGQRFPINHHAVLGRDSSCDITILGKHLSRKHAELAVKGDKLLIRDLNSSNGTYVNDKKITETELKPGDTIRFDVLLFRIYGPEEKKNEEITIKAEEKKSQQQDISTKTTDSKSWKTKPSSVGNRSVTMQMNAVQKATKSLTTFFAVIFSIAMIAALIYLFTQV